MDKKIESRILVCADCKEEFAFTVEAQAYFAERKYTEDPKRCKSCHNRYKKTQRGQQQVREDVPYPE